MNEEEFIREAKRTLPRLLGIYKGKVINRDNCYFTKDVLCLITNNDVLDAVGVNPLFRTRYRKETDRSVSCYAILDGQVCLHNGAFSCVTDEESLRNSLEGYVDLNLDNNLML